MEPEQGEGPVYRPGSQGALLGCVAGALFMILVTFPFLFAMAWGGSHCEPVPQCRREIEFQFAVIAVVIAACAILVGLSVRALHNWAMMRRYDRAQAGRAPLWAAAVAAAAVMILSLLVASDAFPLLF